MTNFFEILKLVNWPSVDNGKFFTDLKRVNSIEKLLLNSDYILMKSDGLSYIYKHKNYKYDLMNNILISCHIDSLYKKHYFDYLNESEIIGTFDNSICNAILLNIMLRNLLPVNAIIAFTGNEEYECLGANQTVNYLIHSQNRIWQKLEVTIVLDVTSEGYENYNFSIENYFHRKNNLFGSKLCFKSKKDFKDYLR